MIEICKTIRESLIYGVQEEKGRENKGEKIFEDMMQDICWDV